MSLLVFVFHFFIDSIPQSSLFSCRLKRSLLCSLLRLFSGLFGLSLKTVENEVWLVRRGLGVLNAEMLRAAIGSAHRVIQIGDLWSRWPDRVRLTMGWTTTATAATARSDVRDPRPLTAEEGGGAVYRPVMLRVRCQYSKLSS